jgi:hypothetical protein
MTLDEKGMAKHLSVLTGFADKYRKLKVRGTSREGNDDLVVDPL